MPHVSSICLSFPVVVFSIFPLPVPDPATFKQRGLVSRACLSLLKQALGEGLSDSYKRNTTKKKVTRGRAIITAGMVHKP